PSSSAPATRPPPPPVSSAARRIWTTRVGNREQERGKDRPGPYPSARGPEGTPPTRCAEGEGLGVRASSYDLRTTTYKPGANMTDQERMGRIVLSIAVLGLFGGVVASMIANQILIPVLVIVILFGLVGYAMMVMGRR